MAPKPSKSWDQIPAPDVHAYMGMYPIDKARSRSSGGVPGMADLRGILTNQLTVANVWSSHQPEP
jgi:hypothetical protein